MPKIQISTQAYEFLRRRVSKKSMQMQSLPDNELRKNVREVKHWDVLNRKLNNIVLPLDTNMMLEVELKRAELKSLQMMILDTMVVIQSKTIPEYEARLSMPQDKKDSYIAKAKALYEGLCELLEVIKEKVNE